MNVVEVSAADQSLLMSICEAEESIFGEGALNAWHLPYVSRHGLVIALIEDSEVIGASESVASMTGPGAAFVVGLWVAPQRRGQGLGRMLVRETVARLGARGYETMSLTCSPQNHVGRHLYESCGFRESASLAEEYGIGEDRLLYELGPGDKL